MSCIAYSFNSELYQQLRQSLRKLESNEIDRNSNLSNDEETESKLEENDCVYDELFYSKLNTLKQTI